MYKSRLTGSSGSGTARHNEKSGGRYNIGTRLIDEEEFKQDHNQVYNDDSKFARQLKKLLREEEEESKIQKIIDLSSYLDHHENIKFVLKLGKPSLNILLKLLWEQNLNESKHYIVECMSKIGSIMMTDRDAYKYFDWAMEILSLILDENSKESIKDNNIKCLVMDAMHQTFLNEILSRYMKENVDIILIELKKLLESTESPNLMMRVAKTILMLSKTYPYAINKMFQDVVDILIAWHIDCTQTDEVIDFTSDALVEFRSNWLNDLNFTFNLLEQFVEDVESYLAAYFEDTNKRRELEHIEKIEALFKVYHTVIRSMSFFDDPYHKPLKAILTTNDVEILVSTLRRLLICVLKIHKSKYSELLFKRANYSIILFCDIFYDTIQFGLSELLIDYLKKQNGIEQEWSDTSDLSFLNLVYKVIGFFIVSNNIEVISHILAYNGRLWNYKFSQNTQIIQECLNIYKLLIVVKSIPIVQEVYKNILQDTDLSFSTIIKYSNSNDILSLISDEEKIYGQKGLERLNLIKQAESNFLFNLCVFAELGNAKNNLILMYALSPTLFELLTGKLSPLNWNLAENFPNIQYSIINRLCAHCQRHENFIITSSLFVNKYGNDSPTKDYFRIIIETITKLITHPTTSTDICLLLLNWSIKIIECITIENSSIFSSNLFVNFINSIITSAYTNEEEIALVCYQFFIRILSRFEKLNDSCLNRLFDLCKYFMMSSNYNLRSSYMKLLALIPINITLSSKADIKSLTYQDFSNFSSISRNNYILSSSECVISMENFKSIMSYVLAGINQDNEPFEKSWLERIYFSCRRPNNDEKSKELGRESMIIDSIIENHDGILWFWALWECAQFCVQSRLKTPLGKAQDTFVAIESVLKNYFNFENHSQSIEKSDKNETFIDFNRISLLLHFVEYLERIIYNAYEGIATGQQMVSKTVKLFFRTNKSTCNEWFSRVRYFLSILCVKCGHYEIAIRNCWEYLNYCSQHNLTNTNEFDLVVQNLTKCFIKLNSSQQLIGLYEWLNKIVKKSGYDWINIAAEEAQGKIENACKQYKESLNKTFDHSNEKISINGSLTSLKFQTERIFECYSQLNDWNEYLTWFLEFKSTNLDNLENQNFSSQLEKCLDINYIKSLGSFEDGDYEMAINNLEKLDSFDNLISSIECKWSLDEIEKLSLKEINKTIMLNRFELSNHKTFLKELNEELSNILSVDEMSYMNNEKLVLSLLTNHLQEGHVEFPFMKDLKLNPSRHSLKIFNCVMMISKTCNDLNFDLTLACSKLARKQNNQNLSLKLLDQQLGFFKTNINTSNIYAENETSNFYDSVSKFMNEIHEISDHNIKIHFIDFLQETSKLLCTNYAYESIDILSRSIVNYANFQSTQTSISLAASFTPGVPFTVHNNGQKVLMNETLNNKCSQSLMLLSKFLIKNQNILKNLNPAFFNTENPTLIDQISASLNKILSFKYIESSKFNLKNDTYLNTESIVGNLLDLSTVLSPKIPKTWFSLANWCYKWGKKYADRVQTTSKSNPNDLLKDVDVSQLLDLLPIHCPEEEKIFIIELYSSCFSLNHAGDENLQNPMYQFNKDTFQLNAQTQLIENCKSLTRDHINSIILFYTNIIDRVIYYHKIACKSYFTYLKLNDKSLKSDEKNISSSLRIIKLLVKYAIELKEDLKTGLDETPSEPWKNIIPQLFSRLNHPELYIRESISQLLCRIARDFPHLIIYPAVVGSQDGPTKIETVHTSKNDNSLFENMGKSQQEEAKIEHKLDIENDSESSDEEHSAELSDELEQEVDEDDNETSNYDDDVQDDSQSELKNAYKYLLDTLTESNKGMIEQVKLFVHEMRRITLLREELWYGTLNQIHSDLNKRVEQLNLEITKTNSNSFLTEEEKTKILKDKYEILLQPLVSILEHVQEITTNLPPETPNEEAFQQEFEEKIKDVINQLKDSENCIKPSNCLILFKQLHSNFHHRSQRRQSNSLQMDQISPKLYNLKSTNIPIPGKDGNYINIHSIANSVLVLPTKTKPKKLFFIGSNGRRYPYLFKGLEDLHLDERIMQLLSIVNSMFSKINKTETIHYHALNYSVTPLGPRSGLISWVEGATPLFNLYKKWQHREAVYLANKAQTQPQQIHILRPNDLFYAKLNPLLKEKGIKNFQENRSDCPISLLRKVLEELIKETPNDLLTKELWCNSSTPANWWNSVQIFTRTTSVMSMIGYVIGLGDRHLDNVMVNLRTGQVVHIDYNICFEKGHNLRVPEKVPFRMTQNIEHALGLSGVEGLFRLSSENVMKVLRQKRETLLTLLEAFVYDPLLDWTGHDTGIIASFYGGGNAKINSEDGKSKKEARKNLEKKQCLNLFQIRLIENKVLMAQNETQLIEYVTQNLNKIKIVIDLAQKRGLNDNLIRLQEQAKIYLDESLTLHEGMKSKTLHPVYTLHDRYNEYLNYTQNLNSVNSSFDSEIEKLNSLSVGHLEAFHFFKLKEFQIEFNSSEVQKPNEIVSEFLSSIGQQVLVEQIDKIFDEIKKFELKTKSILTNVKEMWNNVSKVLIYFSDKVVSYSKHLKLIDWLKQLRVSMEKNVYESISNNFKDEFISNTNEKSIDEIKEKFNLLKDQLLIVEDRLIYLKERKSNIEQNSPNEINENEIFQFLVENLRSDFIGVQLFESLNCSVLQFFSENFQKWFAMETAAINAKENLITLTSIDGDWYLEEMLSLIRNCFHLSQTLSNIYSKFDRFDLNDTSEASFKQSLGIFEAAEAMFQALNDLLIHYNTGLMNKIVKMSFSDEKELNWLLNEFKSMNLEEFFEMLSVQNSNDIINPELVAKINDIKLKYSRLLTNRDGRVSIDILVKLERMFSRIDTEFDKLLKFCKYYYSSQEQSLLNHSLFMLTSNLVYLMDNSNYSFMKNLFLVKKIQSIYSCLMQCDQYRQYCLGDKNEFIFKHDDFIYPIKNYISDFIVQMVNGIPVILIGNLVNILKNDQYSYTDFNIENLNEQISFLINQKLITNQINEYYFNTFNQFMLNFDAYWVNMDLKKRINSNINYNESYINLSKELIKSIEWFYDPYLLESNAEDLSTKTFRELVLENMKTTSEELSKKIDQFKKLLSDLNTNENNIYKRLEWSSNSNPSLGEKIKQFEDLRSKNEIYFKNELKKLSTIGDNLNMWINFENMRAKKSKVLNESKKMFENLMRLVKEKGIYNKEKIANLSDVELNLINFKSFKDKKPLTNSILQEYYKLLYDEVAQMKRIKQKEEKEYAAKIEELNKNLVEFKTILNQHNKLMTDIKPILKSMTKFGENYRLIEYSKTYQKFSETCQQLIRIFSNKDFIESDPKNVEEKLNILSQIVNKIYADLRFVNEPADKLVPKEKLEQKTQETVKVLRTYLEGNSHAISVWKRVYEKLDGRDPDSNYQMNVQEQVDYLIKQATDLNNLAVLYEGWTSWV